MISKKSDLNLSTVNKSNVCWSPSTAPDAGGRRNYHRYGGWFAFAKISKTIRGIELL